MICGDAALAALDRKLVDVYAAASKAASADQKNRLFAEQQSWLVDRNRCTGAPDRVVCARDQYTRRIADLQAQFKLVASRGPFRFICDKDPANLLTAQYFQTDPPTARFFHDGRTVTAFIARAGSGARYDNANISYWEHDGEASVVWYGRKLTCNTRSAQYERAPSSAARSGWDHAKPAIELARWRPRAGAPTPRRARRRRPHRPAPRARSRYAARRTPRRPDPGVSALRASAAPSHREAAPP